MEIFPTRRLALSTRSAGADGGARTRTPLREADFRTTSAFAAASSLCLPGGVRGLDYPFALARKSLRRRPSSLYTFPWDRAWLGIGLGAFPEFERFCSAGFPAGTPIEVCCVCRFRHVRTCRPRGWCCHSRTSEARAIFTRGRTSFSDTLSVSIYKIMIYLS